MLLGWADSILLETSSLLPSKFRDYFLASRAAAQESNEKSKKAGQTSIDTHPARAPKGKTSRQGSDHRTPSIQSPRGPPPLQAERG
jgi:hypothetical protein